MLKVTSSRRGKSRPVKKKLNHIKARSGHSQVVTPVIESRWWDSPPWPVSWQHRTRPVRPQATLCIKRARRCAREVQRHRYHCQPGGHHEHVADHDADLAGGEEQGRWSSQSYRSQGSDDGIKLLQKLLASRGAQVPSAPRSWWSTIVASRPHAAPSVTDPAESLFASVHPRQPGTFRVSPPEAASLPTAHPRAFRQHPAPTGHPTSVDHPCRGGFPIHVLQKLCDDDRANSTISVGNTGKLSADSDRRDIFVLEGTRRNHQKSAFEFLGVCVD